MTSAVIVSVRVEASAQEAFAAFTEDIAIWWRPSALFEITPRGDGELYFEPGPEGRLMTRLAAGKPFEIGRILDWQPGVRLRFSWRQATFPPDRVTEVEVRFEPLGDETRVTVEHRGWDAIPEGGAARHGFPLHPFQARLAEFWRAQLGRLADGARGG
ncbi:MAG: SRPBCC domain-containing protein [Parvularculaceae bacterium]|nr:SRPBCC domain-containing protein [Parvularculaceae bacterium]